MHHISVNHARQLPDSPVVHAALLPQAGTATSNPAARPCRGFRGRLKNPLRRGAAAVEAALSLPVLLILVLGSMESANAVFARQAVSTAAYDAARIATKRGGTQAKAEARCQQMLNAHGITDYSLTMSPTVTVGTARGTTVRATVTVPAQHISLGLMPLFTGTTLHKTVQMIRL